MTYLYNVMYRGADGMTTSAEVTVDSPLEGAPGRAEAVARLADWGVERPQITGWARRGADQERSAS